MVLAPATNGKDGRRGGEHVWLNVLVEFVDALQDVICGVHVAVGNVQLDWVVALLDPVGYVSDVFP